MIRHICVLLIILLLPTVALAQCPTGVQETVVLYLNGVDTTEESATKSMRLIEKNVTKVTGVLVDCIKYDYLYNTNEPLFLDFLQAGIQKAKEQGFDASEFWRWFFRLNPFTSGFSDLIFDYYSNTNNSIDLGLFVLGDQVEEHLTKIREHLSQGKRIILVSHSQGVLYANEEWDALTNEERSNVNIIAVATPTNSIAGNGPYTTIVEDWIASNLFPRAMAANIANDEECPDDWTCHGFKESYMKGNHSRSRIVDQIVSLLPTPPPSCRIEGMVYNNWDNSLDYPGVVNGAMVTIWNYWSSDPVFQTTSDFNGYYCIGNVPDDDYYIDVNHDNQHFGGAEAHLPRVTEPLIIDIMLYAPM